VHHPPSCVFFFSKDQKKKILHQGYIAMHGIEFAMVPNQEFVRQMPLHRQNVLFLETLRVHIQEIKRFPVRHEMIQHDGTRHDKPHPNTIPTKHSHLPKIPEQHPHKLGWTNL